MLSVLIILKTSYNATTTKKQKDDGKSPSCIWFFNGRGIHRHLFPHKPRR